MHAPNYVFVVYKDGDVIISLDVTYTEPATELAELAINFHQTLQSEFKNSLIAVRFWNDDSEIFIKSVNQTSEDDE